MRLGQKSKAKKKEVKCPVKVELTPEQEFCHKLRIMKNLFHKFWMLLDEGKKYNITFLQDSTYRINELYQKEIDNLRIDLCKIRGE